MRVFISYCTHDGLDKAQLAASILAQEGHEPWVWEHNKTPGVFPWEEITDYIGCEADAVLYLCTNGSMKSWGQRKEVAHAEGERKKIIVIRLDRAEVPRVIRFENAERLRSGQFEEAFKVIASKLGENIERIQRLDERVTAGTNPECGCESGNQ